MQVSEVNEQLDRHKRDGKTCPMCRARFPESGEEAMPLVLAQAKAGKAWAQHAMGVRYERGTDGVKRADPRAAAKWFKLAADQWWPSSLFSLGTCHQNGVGVTQSVDEAKRLYTAAAARGCRPFVIAQSGKSRLCCATVGYHYAGTAQW